MPDTEKKTTTTRKRTTQTKQDPKPEKTSRELLIERVTSDFIFKSDLYDEQKAMFGWVKNLYSEFTRDIERLFEASPIDARLIFTDEYAAYKVSVREAERWANTAIANDWKPTDTFDSTKIGGLEYTETEPNTAEPEQTKLCFEVSKACFELTTILAMHLPEGRALSVLCTEMQVVRGWLLDTINLNL